MISGERFQAREDPNLSAVAFLLGTLRAGDLRVQLDYRRARYKLMKSYKMMKAY